LILDILFRIILIIIKIIKIIIIIIDKQFLNAYYMLATLFAETNIDEALRCCALAEKAENERLPFLQAVRIPQKKLMQTLKAFRSQLPKCMKE
jgi:hypothetical protein